MRAQFLVRMVVVAFAEEVQVQVAQQRRKGIRVQFLSPLPVFAKHAQLIREDAALAGELGLEEVGAFLPFQRLGFQRRAAVCLWHHPGFLGRG